MFKSLPRRSFGKLQSVLFPKFFLLTTICALLQLGTTSAVKNLTPKYTLCVLLCSLVNLVILEPKSTTIMFKRHELEDQGEQGGEEYTALKKEFGKLHGMSSLANLGALVGLVAHGGAGLAGKLLV